MSGQSVKTTLLLASILVTFGATPLYANTPPIPESKKQRLESISKNLEQSESKKKELESTVKTLEKDLRTTKEKLVDLGTSIQTNEKKLHTIQDRIKAKEIEKLKIEQELEKDHRYIARLILALQRIRRVPPEALIAKPGAPLETAQSALLLGDILPAINKDAQILKENIEALDRISRELKNEKENVVTTSKELSKEYETLSELTEKRQSLYQRTNRDLKEQQEYVSKISKQVENLNELVKRLEEDKKRKEAQERKQLAEQAIATKPAQQRLASVKRALPGSSASQLPVSGFIKTNFDQVDAFGAPSKGIEISTTRGALVVAPLEGTVRFAGPFKNYRNLIIIEHDRGYHSLIAGLENIDIVVGSDVSAGEPLGRLDSSSSEGDPVLYYELRLNGKPINPAKKLKGFS